MSPLAYPQADADAEQARTRFRYLGGAECLDDGTQQHYWPVRPLEPDRIPPWTWRYGQADAGTGSRYAVLVTRVHPDVASREGGGAIVTVLAPWQDAHALSLEAGWLDESYVAEHLTAGRLREGRLHAGDLAALTRLIRFLLDREDV